MKKYIILLSLLFLTLTACTQKNVTIEADKTVTNETKPIVPPPQKNDYQQNHGTLAPEEELITLFFSLIDRKQIPEAISLMSKTAVPDDSTKQTWGVQFNAITSINILNMEAWDETNWTDARKAYKVTLEAYVKNDPSAPIPFYGWEDNPNIRWIQLIKEDNQWKINNIATGP